MRYAITLISSSVILFMAAPSAHAAGRGGPELAKLLGKMLWREMERLLSLTS